VSSPKKSRYQRARRRQRPNFDRRDQRQQQNPERSLSACLFREVVASCHPGHFALTDTHLIAAYVQAVLMVRRFAKEMKTDRQAVPLWTTAIQVEIRLARALRLIPRSRITPRTAGRMAAAQQALCRWQQ
jgi:hypothetical protein